MKHTKKAQKAKDKSTRIKSGKSKYYQDKYRIEYHFYSKG